MNANLTLATERLLAPGGLEDHHLERLLGTLMAPSVDNADLYFQFPRHESWVLEDGIIKDGSYNIERGVGVRAR